MTDRLDGFAEFVAERRHALSRTAYLLTGDHAAAEDLLQSALTKTAVHWRRVMEGHPEAYIRQIMLNERRSWWRRQQRAPEGLTDKPPERPIAETDNAALDRLVLASALTRLSPRQRAVLYLRYYEDLTEADVAATLGCSVGTVKRHASDALARLRTLAPQLLADNPEAVR